MPGEKDILQAVLIHLKLYTKKNIFSSVKNQVSCCVHVVENGGAEVKHRREGEEGLEGSQPLDEVTCSYSANYGRHHPDAVRHPCSSKKCQIQGNEECIVGIYGCYVLMLSSLCTYRAEIQRIEGQCPDGSIVKTCWVRLKCSDGASDPEEQKVLPVEMIGSGYEGTWTITCTLQKYPAWLQELRPKAAVMITAATDGVWANLKHSNDTPGPIKPIDCTRQKEGVWYCDESYA